MGQKQTKTTRTTVEDLGTAWIIEHKAAALLLLAVIAVLIWGCGALFMESQLAHAGLL